MTVKEIHESAFEGQRWFAGKGRALVRATEAASFGGLVVADVEYAAGPGERYLLLGDVDWPALLAAPPPGLEVRPGPAFARLAPAPGAVETTPSTDQSNTLVGLDGLLVKAYRRLWSGPHPEIELCAALASTPAPVPAYAGSVWHVAEDGTETAIALLQALVPNAESGWEAPILRAVDWLRAPSSAPSPEDEYRAAGAAAATLHAALADVFPAAAATAETGPAWHADALALLDRAAAVEPVVAAAHEEIAARLGALEGAAGLPLTRIHGDLHVAQLLRTPDALLVIDFEGDPTRPLADRRRPDTPLRDLACLLRSVDHVGQAASRRCGIDPEPWIACATRAVLDGYAGVPADPALLNALELAKACQELVYAAAVVPEWSYAPRGGLRRLLSRKVPT